MKLRSLATWLLVGALLSGCSNSIVKQGVSRLSGSSTTTAVQPPKGAPKIWLTLVNKGVKFSMSALQNVGPVTVWAAADGTQAAIRDGMLINTRGFGRDLMSAEVPTMAVLLKPGEHSRVYFDLDGSDAMFRHDFTCTSEVGKDDKAPGLRLITENCVGDLGTIANKFWIDSANRIQKSRQWVSQGVGYAAVEKNEG